MKVMAVIPARGGSKGVPGKNVKLIAGKPLIAHTIEQAQQSAVVGRIFVSTDDADIAAVARKFGAEVVLRPASISGDTATSESAVLHALDTVRDEYNYEPDLVCFLQCTSPVRQAADIDNAVAVFLEQQADSLLTVSPSHRFLWSESSGEARSINYDHNARPRRQDMQPQYVENGSFYLFRPSILRANGNRLGGKVALYVMNEKASYEIDSLLDFRVVEVILTGVDVE